MAEGLLFNFIEKLIGKLGSMAVESWNMRDDVGKLVRNMSEIKAVVLDAEEQQATNHEVQVWVGTLKDALEDAENLLDEISAEDLRREVMTRGKKAKKVRIFFSKSNQLVFSFQMAQRVKDLGERIKDLNVGGRSFKFSGRTLEQRVSEVMRQRETGSFVPEEDVIGREEEKKQIVQWLLETNMDLNENVSIISIVGIGGLGKTALAQLVYNDKAVKDHFRELQMWVCVADEFSAFDVKEVAMKITEMKPSDNPNMDRVQQALREKIKGKRYLLVLDDVWNGIRHLWLDLFTLLKEGAKGSKIMITTRSEEVSNISGTSSSLLLKGLNEEQSWKLFTQLAFKDGKEPENDNMVLIGKEIVKKCSGVPLAIRIVGSLMFSKATNSDWQTFKDRDLVKLDEEGGNKVLEILKLSYDHLPFHLKKCFAFCSLFPKDCQIEKEELIRLWVAHGFVESSNASTCIEDVGNECFIKLSQRSFFQDFERGYLSDDIWRCKMHDLVHDLAKSVSANDCVILTSKEQQIHRETRHLSLDFKVDSSWQVPSSLLKANKLRTVLKVRFAKGELEESACSSIISSLEQVRVLGLRNLNCRKLPSCIGKLVHLRYLDLSWNLIEVLPESITELYNLQTLLLMGCYKLKELPRDLWKLVNLRHLELFGCDALTCMPRGIGQLTNLQTLTQFVLDTKSKSKQSGEPSELQELNNLRGSLQIKGLECLRRNPSKAEDFNFKGKRHLLWLTLNWGDDERFEEGRDKDNVILEALLSAHNIKNLWMEGFGGDAISGSVTSFTNVRCVTLRKCTRLQYLPPLHLLLHLKYLYLEGLAGVECIYNNDGSSSNDTSSIFFPSLKSIRLWNLPNLKGWCRCSEESCQHRFKALDSLSIYNCPNLISIPQHSYIKDVLLIKVNEKVLERVLNHSQVSSLSIENIYGLRSLSRILQHLVAVSSLQIQSCEELDPCNDGMQWRQLANLRSLVFYSIPKMESLPDGLQHVTSLETLSISYCANLKCIPEWVTSLQSHRIRGCPNLTSIPEGVNVSN